MAAAVQIDGWLVVVTERAAGGRTVITGTVTTNTAATQSTAHYTRASSWTSFERMAARVRLTLAHRFQELQKCAFLFCERVRLSRLPERQSP
jgi:hypothetical protein